MTVFTQYLVNGLSMGSVYAIIALGYTMVYGIAKMLNFAHGDVIMVGAYVSFCATSYLGLPGWASVVLSCVACTVLGVLIEGLAYKPLRQAGPAGRSDHGYRRVLLPAERRAASVGRHAQELHFARHLPGAGVLGQVQRKRRLARHHRRLPGYHGRPDVLYR